MHMFVRKVCIEAGVLGVVWNALDWHVINSGGPVDQVITYYVACALCNVS